MFHFTVAGAADLLCRAPRRAMMLPVAIEQFQVDRLRVHVYASRAELGGAAAARAALVLRDAIAREGHAAAVFAAAASQNEFLAALRADTSIDWARVTAFHLDEYAGIGSGHPASFRRFLRERLMDHVP